VGSSGLGWCGDGWVPGVAGEGVVEGAQGVVAVFAEGVEVAADVEAVLGDVFAGESAGNFLLGFGGSGREGDRLQHLRAVLPCEVRVIGEAHPLFGRLVRARSFKRWHGVLCLVIELPDGSPGTIRADATDVLGAVTADGPAVVVDAEGLRRLRSLVLVLGSRAGRDGAGR
jgi:hypothetical protein